MDLISILFCLSVAVKHVILALATR